MKILFHKNFIKQLKRFPANVQAQFQKRLKLFMDDPFHPTLSNHALRGEWHDFRSINVTGDVRALYMQSGENIVEFVIIDTHSNLYS